MLRLGTFWLVCGLGNEVLSLHVAAAFLGLGVLWKCSSYLKTAGRLLASVLVRQALGLCDSEVPGISRVPSI